MKKASISPSGFALLGLSAVALFVGLYVAIGQDATPHAGSVQGGLEVDAIVPKTQLQSEVVSAASHDDATSLPATDRRAENAGEGAAVPPDENTSDVAPAYQQRLRQRMAARAEGLGIFLELDDAGMARLQELALGLVTPAENPGGGQLAFASLESMEAARAELRAIVMSSPRVQSNPALLQNRPLLREVLGIARPQAPSPAQPDAQPN